MSELGPLDHLPRTLLPWRTEPDLTECGRPIGDVGGRIVTVAELQARIASIGRQRAAFTACMTCMEAADRHHRAGAGDAMGAIARELAAVQYVSDYSDAQLQVIYGGPGARRRGGVEKAKAARDRRRRFAAELDAIAALVAAHRDEFDGYLADRAETASLDEARAARRLKRAR
jgi:hypothetical protein